MVGVPSSRACNACRAQRKKCDTATPPCSRCKRLNIPCIGAGQQRFKFVDQKHGSLAATNSADTSRGSSATLALSRTKSDTPIARPSQPLCNKLTLLTSAFGTSVDITADIKYQLPYSFGLFLLEVPKRLGTNEALDAAADALVVSHADFCNGNKGGQIQTLQKQTRAISALRQVLDDPVKARTSETLAAIMILSMIQAFVGKKDGVGHSNGAVQILKARGCTGARDSFEAELLATMRGPIMIEAIYDPRIDLSEAEWQDLARPVARTSGSPEETVLQCLSRAPYLMSRIDKVRRHIISNQPLQDLFDEAVFLRQTLKSGLQSIYEKFDNIDTLPPKQRRNVRAYIVRIYAFAVAGGILLNCILEDLAPDPSLYRDESAFYTREVIRMAELLMPFRPIGSLILGLCLSLAFLGAPDAATRMRIKELYADFQKDFGSEKKGEPMTLDCLTRNPVFSNALRSRGYFDVGKAAQTAMRSVAEKS